MFKKLKTVIMTMLAVAMMFVATGVAQAQENPPLIWNTSTAPTITADGFVEIQTGASGTLIVPSNVTVTIIGGSSTTPINTNTAIGFNVGANSKVIWKAYVIGSGNNQTVGVNGTGAGEFEMADGLIQATNTGGNSVGLYVWQENDVAFKVSGGTIRGAGSAIATNDTRIPGVVNILSGGTIESTGTLETRGALQIGTFHITGNVSVFGRFRGNMTITSTGTLNIPSEQTFTVSTVSNASNTTITNNGTINGTLINNGTINCSTGEIWGEIAGNKANFTGTVNFPSGLTATFGQTLADVLPAFTPSQNPAGTFAWTNAPSTPVGDIGTRAHSVSFTLANQANYSNPTQQQYVDVEVGKINYDMSGISFANASREYNGEVQSLTISGELPSGVSVIYESATDRKSVGDHIITAVFSTTSPATHNTPAQMQATLTITPCQHKWGGWENITAATCVSRARGDRECEKCGTTEVNEEFGEVNAHDFPDGCRKKCNNCPAISADCEDPACCICNEKCNRHICETCDIVCDKLPHICADPACNRTTTCGAHTCDICGIVCTLEECAICGKTTSITNAERNDSRYGIRFAKNIVSDVAEISVVLPDMRATEAVAPTVVIYDMTGNVVFACRGDCPQSPANNTIIWDLRNSAGRFVANGTYLVVAEVKGRDGRTYQYSAKLGVKR